MKVKLTSKVSSFRVDVETEYKPGDVFEVEDRLFHPEYMVKVEEPIVEPVVEPEEPVKKTRKTRKAKPEVTVEPEASVEPEVDVKAEVVEEEASPSESLSEPSEEL